LATQTSRGTQSEDLTNALVFDDRGLDVASTPSARNLTAEAFHAFRRRWLAAPVAGLVAGLIVACVVWCFLPRRYLAIAVLRVSMGESNILAPGQPHDAATSFDVYKRTQRQLLRSPSVLKAALQRPSVSHLPLVTQQREPLAWLQEIVNVTFPDDAEIMNVSVDCEDQGAAETLADEIVDVYLQNIVYAERQAKLNRINDLEKAQTETEASLRKRGSDLRQLADALGTSDSEALTLEQKNTLQEYSLVWTELKRVEFDLKRAQRLKEIRDRGGPAAPVTEFSVSDAEVEAASLTDAIIAAGKADLERQQARIDDARKAMYGARQAEYIASYQAAIERARKRIEDRKVALRKEVAIRKQSLALASDQSSAMSVELLDAEQKQLAAKVGELRKAADKFGRSSVDAELMRAEIKALDDLHNRVQRELQAANIEIAIMKARVVKISPATTSHAAEHIRRLTICAVSGGAGFFASCGLVLLWDLRRRRLNTLQEIADALGLPVLGTMPHVKRLQDRNASSSEFAEAIDGIAAKVVFSPSGESMRVVLVTSASAGEGKTTVAVNLATSFAGMGRRTVLVDFDLRRPMLHNMFDVELDPGVGGVLAGQAEPLDAVRATSVENLFVLPAGEWGNGGLSGRNDQLVTRIVSALRAAFVNVVIDAGPILPIVDTRVVARHADGVVISLLRDVSEIPRVNLACELLRSFDVRILGAVMIGAPGEVYYAHKIDELQESA